MLFFDSRMCIIVCLLLASCQSRQEKDATQAEEEITGDMDIVEEADFTGIYTQGKGYSEFKSCDDWQIYPLASQNPLAPHFDSLNLASGTSMYVRIDGEKIRSDDQTALQVAKVIQAEKYAGQENCPSFNGRTFIFRGNEPFWSLRMDGEQVVFNHFERDSVVFDFQPLSWQDSVWLLTTKNQEQELRAYISEAPCIGTMSGIRYDMSVTVQTAGESYRGCGGWQEREQPGQS